MKLKGGDVVVTGFDNSNTLGGANTSDSKLPTQKAVKDFITNNLGPYINKPYSTNPVPRALVELTDSGKISEDQIPPLRPFQVYTVANQAERVAIEGALAGDIAIQQDTSTSFILNNDNDSLFASFAVDTTLQFTVGDIFTGSITGGKLQATEYRQGVLYQMNITDGGSGYVTPPIITISGGNPQAGAVAASATATIANGQVVIISIDLFNGFIGGKGYTTPPVITIAAPAGSGTQATAVALLESWNCMVKSLTILRLKILTLLSLAIFPQRQSTLTVLLTPLHLMLITGYSILTRLQHLTLHLVLSLPLDWHLTQGERVLQTHTFPR